MCLHIGVAGDGDGHNVNTECLPLLIPQQARLQGVLTTPLPLSAAR
jgi:hypothetical protein